MSHWESMPWSSAMCFTLAAVVIACVAFLIWDNWKHREPKRPPMATPMSVDELKLRRLKKSVARYIATKKMANSK